MPKKKMTTDEKLDKKNFEVMKMTDGMFAVQPAIPLSLYSGLSESLWNYLGMPRDFQRNKQRAHSIRGRMGWFVCQMSHGSQQIKLYEPWKYKTEVNTPLRIRARTIMQVASQEPLEKRKDKVRELYRSYPYHLLKAKPVNLRLKNFYFEKDVIDGSTLKVYRAVDPDNPDPQTDPLYGSKDFKKTKTVKFEYDGQDEEYYYAVNTRSGEISNLLKFIWQEEIEFNPQGTAKPNKWAVAAEIVNSGDEDIKLDQLDRILYSEKEEEALQGADIKSGSVRSGSKGPAPPAKTAKRKQRKALFWNEIRRMQSKYELLKETGFLDKKNHYKT